MKVLATLIVETLEFKVLARPKLNVNVYLRTSLELRVKIIFGSAML